MLTSSRFITSKPRRKICSNDLADENKLLCITNGQFTLQSHHPILHNMHTSDNVLPVSGGKITLAQSQEDLWQELISLYYSFPIKFLCFCCV